MEREGAGPERPAVRAGLAQLGALSGSIAGACQGRAEAAGGGAATALALAGGTLDSR